MSNEAFVDVTWRGLEVGKRVKLHGIHPGDGYLDHATPMPVGTLLSIKTDDGLEFSATVTRVHEQVGGTNESPGMQIAPSLEGAAKAWWKTRAEALPAPVVVAAPDLAPTPAASPAAVLAAAAGNGNKHDPRADIVARSTLTMSTVEVQRALAAMKADDADDRDAGTTDVMEAVDPATIEGLAGETDDDGIVDDGKRTSVMSAVDVSAIVEATETETSGAVNGDDGGNGTDDGPTGDGPAAAGTGKKRRGKRSKRGTSG